LSDYFPIKTVSVYGVNRADHQEVQNLLLPLVHHGFFTVNVDDIRDRLLQMPWIADIAVRRDWPDRIKVTIIEKTAVARWNNESLLSETGELFSPKPETYPALLPMLLGPEGQQERMLQYFNTINHLLTPLHAKISYLELTPYFTWKLVLDNGISLQIGHKDILTRLTRFVKVYPKIIGERAAEVNSIDLRYANGLAIQWKPGINYGNKKANK
jgi:cell division protein FtsQ